MPEERIQLSDEEMALLLAYAALLDMSVEDALAHLNAGLAERVAERIANAVIKKCKTQAQT